MFKTLFLVVLTTALINNVVLSQFLGICSFIGVSKNIKTAAGMGGAVIFVITIASAVTNLLYTGVIQKLGLEYLNTIIFILVIAALVQFIELFLKKYVPKLYQALGIYLPLITTNCAVLGVALTNVQDGNDFITSVVTGFGTALGYAVAIIILAGIREKTESNDIPKAFKGTPAVLLTSCLMAIAFYGFSSLA
ncbi:MAG TPA: RnfABCDGE type electron transport complex subunit A [Candidatus Eubacterium faecipullorum]|uniref:Ion-translocating oxidoreductase complex subunit A n=1 Tax=Candidatus Eubacterium faecipullorum TaxID=2838571 RepID=A0A9D1RD72_9FIRM|nr:RnfABCDGE type electron transport complex subunit A [Candidatus Eubacterium faecipullorum]